MGFRLNTQNSQKSRWVKLPIKYVRVSDRTRLQKLFISVNTPFTRVFWVKIPVYGSCAANTILGGLAILGTFGLFGSVFA